MNLHRYGLALGLALTMTTSVVACSDDGPSEPALDETADGSVADAGRDTGSNDRDDAGTSDTGTKDAGPKDGGGDAKDADADAPELGPGVVADLTATAESHTSVKLSWTAPAPLADAGAISSYEIRYATTPIATEADFLAATPGAWVEAVAGSTQTATISELTLETTYHFALRATDDNGGFGPVSNDASATTKTRARLLITEVAPANTAAEGGDFVELVAIAAGSVADLELRYPYDVPLHRFAPLDVQVGDRIVVHLTGLPGPAGSAQEDATRDKASSTAPNASPDAFDVYSATTDLPLGAGVLVSDGVSDGLPVFRDIVLHAGRTPDGLSSDEGLSMSVALAYSFSEWMFSDEALLATNDGLECPLLSEVVNASGSDSPPCGGLPGYLRPGWSIQRNGVVDTNTRFDFFVAPQTRGAANRPFCAPEGAQVALTEVNPRAGLIELSVVQGGHLRGFELRTNPVAAAGAGAGAELAALPDFCPATGDTIVVHLGAAGSPTETTAKDEHPSATHSSYYDGAWDVATSNTVSFNTTLVLGMRSPANVFVEAGAFSDHGAAPPAEYEASLAYVQGLGLWLPADCGGLPCTGSTTPTARGIAANWSLVGATASTSLTRSSAAAPPQASSWSVGASTFGQ